jgi:hypothetical protein
MGRRYSVAGSPPSGRQTTRWRRKNFKYWRSAQPRSEKAIVIACAIDRE